METIQIITASRSPEFQDLKDLGLSIRNDWFGRPLKKNTRLIFWISEGRFHFLTEVFSHSGLSHPGSQAGDFHAELWKYDVSEFFLSDPVTGKYLEFNLAPNAAWWCCGFSSPRQPAAGEPEVIPDVRTNSQQAPDSWRVHASLPLSWLQEHYGFGELSRLNATLITNSPTQIFLTAGAPSDGEPNFHRPEAFPKVEFIALA